MRLSEDSGTDVIFFQVQGDAVNVMRELQEFARRRPGTFIVAAVAAGFVVGRLGKGFWQNQHESRER